MKKYPIIIFISIAVWVPSANGQVPLCRLSPIDEIDISPDTFQQYFLVDINGDSVKDLFYSSSTNIFGKDLAADSALFSPITESANFVFNIEKDSDENNIIIAALKGVNNDTLVMIRQGANPYGNIDTFYSDLRPTREWWWYYNRYIMPFNVDSTGTKGYLYFWGIVTQEGPDSYSEGYYLGVDENGNIVITPQQTENCTVAFPFIMDDSLYLATLGWYSWLDRYSSGSGKRIRIYDHSLRLVASFVIHDKYWGNLKFIPGLFDDNCLGFVDRSQIYFFNDPYLSDTSIYNMICYTLISPFTLNGSHSVIIGCQNNYFELRDMNLNLQAFIWGPNITITDADAIDIDRDGTDELLCRTATGFVLYRLDTTSVAVNEDVGPVPKQISLSAYPNPFNSEVNISLSGVESLPVPIGIYDISGRLVRSLLITSGDINWDGHSDQGGAASSGVYLVRAIVGQRAVSTKIVLLR
jgi:hypothetical protein